MKKRKSLQSDHAFVELQQILVPALAMLDLRGTDETISKVLAITNQAFKSLQNREDIDPKKLYSKAMKIYKQQNVTQS